MHKEVTNKSTRLKSNNIERYTVKTPCSCLTLHPSNLPDCSHGPISPHIPGNYFHQFLMYLPEFCDAFPRKYDYSFLCFLLLLPPNSLFYQSMFHQERDEILKFCYLKGFLLRQGIGKLQGSVLQSGASNSGALFPPLGLKENGREQSPELCGGDCRVEKAAVQEVSPHAVRGAATFLPPSFCSPLAHSAWKQRIRELQRQTSLLVPEQSRGGGRVALEGQMTDDQHTYDVFTHSSALCTSNLTYEDCPISTHRKYTHCLSQQHTISCMYHTFYTVLY